MPQLTYPPRWTLVGCFHAEDDAIRYRDRLQRSGSGKRYAVRNHPRHHGSADGAWRVWDTGKRGAGARRS